MAEPLMVLDVADWRERPPSREFLKALNEWTDRHGIQARDTYRIEIHQADELLAKVFAYDRTECGHHYCGVDHDHLDDPARCEIARREPYTVPVSSMPPEFTPAEETR